MFKRLIVWAGLLLVGGVVLAAPMSIDDKAKTQVAIFKESLQLTDDQVAAVTAALVEKLAVGKEAYGLKKDGKEDEAKAMNKEAGRVFQAALSGILTKEQKATWKSDKDAIMDKVKEIK